MSINILLIDPDVRFAAGIKRGLEQTGEYRVTVFANAQAALDHLPTNPHAAAVIDSSLIDVRLTDLVNAMRIIQPRLPIVLSTAPDELPTGLLTSTVQATLPKPYVARLLIPQIQIAIALSKSGTADAAAPKPIKRLAAVPSDAQPATPPPDSAPASVMSAVAGDSSRVMRPIDPAAFSAAELTLRLSRLKTNPPVQAIILTRAGMVMSATGTLTDRALSGLTDAIAHVWERGAHDEVENAPRLRFVQVQDAGEVIVYSISRGGDWRLTLVFPAETPIRDVRQEARQLIELLENRQPAKPVPIPVETLDTAESESARTLVSRPTDLRPPKGLAEARLAAESTAPAPNPLADPLPELAIAPPLGVPAPDVPEIPYSPYTLLWQPNNELIGTETAALLPGWIDALGVSQMWRVHETTISSGCVSVRIDLPADQLPGTAIDMLQQATAQRAGRDDLWASCYYVIASDRAPLPQEIAQFAEYGAALRPVASE